MGTEARQVTAANHRKEWSPSATAAANTVTSTTTFTATNATTITITFTLRTEMKCIHMVDQIITHVISYSR